MKKARQTSLSKLLPWGHMSVRKHILRPACLIISLILQLALSSLDTNLPHPVVFVSDLSLWWLWSSSDVSTSNNVSFFSLLGDTNRDILGTSPPLQEVTPEGIWKSVLWLWYCLPEKIRSLWRDEHYFGRCSRLFYFFPFLFSFPFSSSSPGFSSSSSLSLSFSLDKYNL